MALTYSFAPLRAWPSLIPACVDLLKNEWPHCRAELLPKLVKLEQSHVPCSLCMVEHRSFKNHRRDTLVAHFRMVPVVNRPKSVFFEVICIDKERRGRGLAKKVMACSEEYAKTHGYQEFYFRAVWSLKNYYVGLAYEVYTKPLVCTLGANMLRAISKDSPMNIPYPGLESLNDTSDPTSDELRAQGLSEFGWFFKRTAEAYNTELAYTEEMMQFQLQELVGEDGVSGQCP